MRLCCLVESVNDEPAHLKQSCACEQGIPQVTRIIKKEGGPV